MRRLSGRLIWSHIAVAVLAGATMYAIVRFYAPRLFDESLGRGRGGMGAGSVSGVLRQQFGDAVDSALLWGTLVGVAAAALLGVVLARWLLAPLGRVRQATKQIAAGRYDARVKPPSLVELADLAEDVNVLATSLAETESRRTRLLGEVAHEMRTPLTVIDGYVEAMIDGVMPSDAENLGQISDEVRRLRRLAEDLSTLSRAEEGRLTYEFAVLEVGTVVQAVAERLRPQAHDAGVDLRVTIDGVARVNADADRIAQVITNLLGNALRATPSGGRIDASVRTAEGIVQVAVADTGEGLAADDVERIFERFYRVGRRSPGDTGSGIGLTIARAIMRAHGGDLVASSDGLGCGARFVATLPVAR